MKKPMIIGGGILGAILITWGLIWLAQGESYQLSVLDPIIGDENAPVLIEEFSDFQCPACGAVAPVLKEALKNYTDEVKLSYKDFPLASIHPQARTAAAGALCAAQQDEFQSFHDALFENQSQWAEQGGDVREFMLGLVNTLGLDQQEWETCIDSRDVKKAIDADFEEGRSRGVNATPTFFVNGEQIQTPQSVFQWIQLIDGELEKQGIMKNSMEDQSEGGQE